MDELALARPVADDGMEHDLLAGVVEEGQPEHGHVAYREDRVGDRPLVVAQNPDFARADGIMGIGGLGRCYYSLVEDEDILGTADHGLGAHDETSVSRRGTPSGLPQCSVQEDARPIVEIGAQRVAEKGLGGRPGLPQKSDVASCGDGVASAIVGDFLRLDALDRPARLLEGEDDAPRGANYVAFAVLEREVGGLVGPFDRDDRAFALGRGGRRLYLIMIVEPRTNIGCRACVREPERSGPCGELVESGRGYVERQRGHV